MSVSGDLDYTITDDAVAFAFTVENVGTEPVDVDFRSGKHADVVVYDEGVEVWRWSEGRMFTQALKTETLAPGESVVHEMVWEDPSPGEYTAEASLAATNVSLVARTPLTVT